MILICMCIMAQALGDTALAETGGLMSSPDGARIKA